MLEERIQDLLVAGSDVEYFAGCCGEELRAYLGNLKAHRCRLDAVEANVVVALNRLAKQTSSKARPSDSADDIQRATGESRFEAAKTARRAELFERLPEVNQALAAGEITAGHVDLLTSIPHKWHHTLEEELQALLRKARVESVDEFRHTVRHWKDQTAKANGEDPHQRRRDNRSCSIRGDRDGIARLNALLDPEAGAIVRNAITHKAQALLRRDQNNDETGTRSYQQRLADALTAICTNPRNANHNEDEGGPAKGRREPTVVVGIQLSDLQAGRDGTAYGTGPISAETARKLACECAIIPIVLGSNSVVLDMGRKTRLATSHQRLALATRYDNHCTVPGCDRPFEWCHIHHIDHWEHGGPTNLDNLIPVCSRHHTQIHDGRLQIQRHNSQDHWHHKPNGRRPARVS